MLIIIGIIADTNMSNSRWQSQNLRKQFNPNIRRANRQPIKKVISLKN